MYPRAGESREGVGRPLWGSNRRCCWIRSQGGYKVEEMGEVVKRFCRPNWVKDRTWVGFGEQGVREECPASSL